MSSFVFFRLLKELKKSSNSKENFLVRLGQQKLKKLFRLRKKNLNSFKKDLVFSKKRTIRKILRNRINFDLKFRKKILKYTEKFKFKHKRVRKLLVSLIENRVKSYFFFDQKYGDSKFLNYSKLKTEVSMIYFNTINIFSVTGKRAINNGFEGFSLINQKKVAILNHFLSGNSIAFNGDLNTKYNFVNFVLPVSVGFPLKFSDYKFMLYKESLFYGNVLKRLFYLQRGVLETFLDRIKNVSSEYSFNSLEMKDMCFSFVNPRVRRLEKKSEMKRSTPLRRMKKFLKNNNLQGYQSLNELVDFFKSLKEKDDFLKSFKILQRQHGIYTLRFFRTKRHKFLNFFFKHKLTVTQKDKFFFSFYGKIRRYLGFYLKHGLANNYNEFFKFKYGGKLFELQFKIFIKIFRYIVSSLNKDVIKGMSHNIYSKVFNIFIYFYFFINRKKYFYNKLSLYNQIKVPANLALKNYIYKSSLRSFKKFRRKGRKKKRSLVVWRMFSITSKGFLEGGNLDRLLISFFNSNLFFFDINSNFFGFFRRSSRLNFLAIFFRDKKRRELFDLQLFSNMFFGDIFELSRGQLGIPNLFYFRFL